jgi:hypothetical protein
MVYLMFFWSPTDPPVTTYPSVGQGRTSVVRTHSQAPRLDTEHVWYGLTFRGYCDDYSVSTMLELDEAMQAVRVFFAGRKGNLLLEDEHRLLFSRGKRIYKYLGGSDTWLPQEIEASFQPENGVTKISIQYRVSGWHLRTPPNQFRREVLQLRTQLICAEQEA